MLSYESLFGWVNHLDAATSRGETITFSLFEDPTPNNITTPTVTVGWEESSIIPYSHSAKQASFIRSVFEKLDPLIDLDFVEVDHSDGADITIFRAWSNSYWTSLGWSQNDGIGGGTCHYLYEGADIVWRDLYRDDAFNNYEKKTIVHEIGHALGLDHPDGEGANPNWDRRDSIMSYNGNHVPLWFKDLDILALQGLWGKENDSYDSSQTTVTGSEGKDKLIGTDGSDEIIGKGGSDKINAKSGDDLIDPGLWTSGKFDKIKGGHGSDTFVVKDGYWAFIKDFNIVEDKLDISGLSKGLKWSIEGGKTYIFGDDGYEVARFKGRVDLSDANFI